MHALNSVEFLEKKRIQHPDAINKSTIKKTVAKIISQNLSQQNAANKRGQEGQNIEK